MGVVGSSLDPYNVVVSSAHIPLKHHHRIDGWDALPDEIILHIVYLTGATLKMAVVSSRVRRICLSHTRLWSSINLRSCRSLARLPIYMERSGRARLTAYITFSGHHLSTYIAEHEYQGCYNSHAFPPASCPTLFALLRDHSSRFQTLNVFFRVTDEEHDWVWSILNQFNFPAPDLQSFAIHGVPHSTTPFPEDFPTRSSPALREFSFSGSISLIPTFKTWWTHTITKLVFQLHSIHQSGAIDVLAVIQAHSNTLIELELVNSEPPLSAEFHFASGSQIYLPTLQRLTLHSLISPIHYIEAPALESFQLVSPSLLLGNPRPLRSHACRFFCSAAREQLLAFLRKHAGSLKDLSLWMQCSHGGIHESMDAAVIICPILDRLSIHTTLRFDEQPLFIEAPSLVTLHCIVGSDRACRDVFRLGNRYSESLRFLSINGRRFDAPWPRSRIPVTLPVQFPHLYRITIRSGDELTLHDMIRDSIGRKSTLTTILQSFGPRYKWTAISDGYFHLCLDGTALISDIQQ